MFSCYFRSARSSIAVVCRFAADVVVFHASFSRSRTALIAENVFLRKQLAFYQEHQVKPKRLTDSARLALVFWSRFFNWRSALVIVQPATLVGWHRKAFRLFWKWKSRPGRPRLPQKLRQLIARMVQENPTWGEERIADELWLKLGLQVSPRTIRAYWPDVPATPRRGRSPGWSTFVRNHAQALLACDFMVAITVRFRILYILVVMKVGSRRILHCNLTDHPTAEWTIQQLREAIPSDHSYRFLIHDRHSTFSPELDEAVRNLGIEALRTPVRTPQANAFCERLIGTLRRECLDFMIPLSDRHLRQTIRQWMTHYNRGRPHSSLGPGIPDRVTPPPQREQRHLLRANERIVSTPILAGLHHEYSLQRVAA